MASRGAQRRTNGELTRIETHDDGYPLDYDTAAVAFGHNMRAIREARGITQAVAAEWAGMSEDTLRRRERTGMFAVGEALDLCELYEVHPLAAIGRIGLEDADLLSSYLSATDFQQKAARAAARGILASDELQNDDGSE